MFAGGRTAGGGGGRTPGSPPSRVSNAQEHDPESPPLGKRPGPWPPRALGIESGGNDHNPKLMGNWARRTGFKTTVSTESFVSSPNTSKEIGNPGNPLSFPPTLPKPPGYANRGGNAFDLEAVPTPTAASKATTLPNGMNDTAQKIKKPPQAQKPELAPPDALPTASTPSPIAVPAEKKVLNADKNNGVLPSSSRPKPEPVRVNRERDPEQDLVSEDAEEMMAKQSLLKYDIRETPGIVSLILYAIQHYISIIGSLILIPLVIVPAMHGSDEDTAKVVSTVLLVSGISTLLHSFFGSRLPLVQGASFVYLAPALSIIFSNEFSATSKNRFQHTMRELQGAMIVGSVFQFILGYSGLMSLFLSYLYTKSKVLPGRVPEEDGNL